MFGSVSHSSLSRFKPDPTRLRQCYEASISCRTGTLAHLIFQQKASISITLFKQAAGKRERREDPMNGRKQIVAELTFVSCVRKTRQADQKAEYPILTVYWYGQLIGHQP